MEAQGEHKACKTKEQTGVPCRHHPQQRELAQCELSKGRETQYSSRQQSRKEKTGAFDPYP
ncbi:hypothetical protein D3C73_1263200 [compost metagenome]